MESIRNISDDELRKRLDEYGISSPVTASTRDVLLKKLNNVMGTKKKTNKYSKTPSQTYKNHAMESRYTSHDKRLNHSLNSFSSDEDETESPSSNSRLKRSLRSNSRLEDSAGDQSFFQETSKVTARKPLQPISVNNDRDPPSSYSYTQLILNQQNKLQSNGKTFEQDESDSYSDSDIEKVMDQSAVSEEIEDPCSSKFYKNFKIFDSLTDKRKLPVVSTVKNNAQRGTESRTLRNPYYPQISVNSPDDIVSQERLPTFQNGEASFSTESEVYQNGSWLQFVPIVLLAMLTIFFVSLAVMYLNINKSLNLTDNWQFFSLFGSTNDVQHFESDPSPKTISGPYLNMFTQSDSRNKFPVCQHQNQMGRKDCVTKLEMLHVPSILAVMDEVIKPDLLEQASSYQCGSLPHYYMTKDDIISKLLKSLPTMPADDIENGVNGVGTLLSLNPHWGLESVWSQTQVYPKTYELLGFAMLHRPTQIWCHITGALKNMVVCGGLFTLGCVSLWLLYRLSLGQKEKKKHLALKAFELVEEILEILEKSCGTEGKEYLAVNHVRDCLISPRDRRTKADIWNRAVQFIDEHESRVYREIRLVGGEDTEVWRWVSGAPRAAIPSPQRGAYRSNTDDNCWQGNAFESSRDLPITSPTSCLKIRKMFDPELEVGDGWPVKIQEDLLEKCSAASIVHVAVDKTSKEGCVYFKCSSTRDAGVAFAALHGTWYNGNLVTVKYLREERYYERFPTARKLVTPLQVKRRLRRGYS